MRKSFELQEIKPNPFRHIEHYPIQPDKVEALRESIRETGFWANIVARPAENGSGAEIAYGHHRLAALREEFEPDHKVELEVRDLSDERMLKIMARENMEEWGTSVFIEMETVKSVVDAYAEDRIELAEPPENISESQIRYAPSFVKGEGPRDGTRPYTATSVADFLGWVKPGTGEPQEKVEVALGALELIEEGVLDEDDFQGLSRQQALEVIRSAREAQRRKEQVAQIHEQQAEQAEKEAESAASEKERERAKRRATASRQKADKYREEAERSRQRVGKSVSRELREGKIGTKQARSRAREIDEPEEKEERVVHARKVARQLTSEIVRVLDPDRHKLAEKIEEIIRLRDMLDEDDREEIATCLDQVAERATEYAEKISEKSGDREALPA